MNDNVETIDMTTDDSLLESLSEHKIEDLKLEPYSLLRQAVASDLCDRGGVLFSAVITVWVCTLKPKEVLAAHRDIEDSQMKAFQWGESRGYDLANWKPVVDAYNQLNREWIAASKARVKEDQLNGEDETPNSGGQLVQ